MPNDGTVSYEEDPDHMIIWLDVTIGNPLEYQHLKAAFSSTADPKIEMPVKLVDKDYDEILRIEVLCQSISKAFDFCWQHTQISNNVSNV